MNRPRRATDGPRKPLTAMQSKIAERILRNLSYEEIGTELGISPHTVRQHVRAMALLFEHPDDMAPRMMIFVWKQHEQWLSEQPDRQPREKLA